MQSMNVLTLRRTLIPFLLVPRLARSLAVVARTGHYATPAHHIGIEGDQFVLDGKPLQIISGELHYERIPREYWRDRLKKARAMGLNTISTYVFWNLHEPQARRLRFQRVARRGRVRPHRAGRRALCASCVPGRMPAPSGIWAACRRGCSPIPTSFCAAPTKNFSPRPSAGSKTRQGTGPTADHARRAHHRRAGRKRVRLVRRRHEYMKRILAALRNAGLGEVLLYTADGGDELPAGTSPRHPRRREFRSRRDAKAEFAKLQKFRPGAP